MKSEALWVIVGVIMVGAFGALYMSWYNQYHGQMDAVMDCEIEVLREFIEAAVPLRMNSKELFEHCAKQVLAEGG